MRRLIPSPWLSLGIFAGWLLLNRSTSAGQVVLAALVAVAVPLLMAPLRPTPGPLRRRRRLGILILCVGRDVITSAIAVAIGTFWSRRRPPVSAFVVIPLDLRDAHGLAALAMITTVVPGTVWCELAPDRSRLLLHVFNLTDEAAFIAHFKADYEQPLKDIFG